MMKNKELKIFCLIAFVGFIYSSCSPLPPQAPQVNKGANKYQERLECKQRLELVRKNKKEWICGEGIAGLNEPGVKRNDAKAISLAKDRARDELSRNLKVKIVNTTVDVIKAGDKNVVEQRFTSHTESYTNQLLEEVTMDYCMDYPKRNLVSALACIRREDYRKKVEEDMERKKRALKAAIEEAMNEWEKLNFKSAVELFLDAKGKLKEYFEDLPVSLSLKGEEIRDAGVFLKARLTELINGLRIECRQNQFVFRADGTVLGTPLVYVYYVKDGERYPIENVPVRASFIRGEGRLLTNNLYSGAGGSVNLRVERVNAPPGEDRVTLVAKIDGERLGLGNVQTLPEVSIDFIKQRTMGIGVIYQINDRIAHAPNSILQNLKRIASQANFEVVEVSINGNDNDLENARNLNADYLARVILRAHSRNEGYGAYSCVVAGEIEVYSVFQGNFIASESTGRKEGYGYSAPSACSDGLRRLLRSGNITSSFRRALGNTE